MSINKKTILETERLLTRKETAEMLGISEGTLAVWACTKRYHLDYIKVGRSVRYRFCDIEKFINSRTKEGRSY
jgi:predicted DNA-binding transcriptional regulator AlpA